MKTFSQDQFLETKVLVFWPKVIFKTLVENSSVVTNDTQRPWQYPHHQKQLQGTSMFNVPLKPHYFYLIMDKPCDHYFQVWSPYYQVAQCNQ